MSQPQSSLRSEIIQVCHQQVQKICLKRRVCHTWWCWNKLVYEILRTQFHWESFKTTLKQAPRGFCTTVLRQKSLKQACFKTWYHNYLQGDVCNLSVRSYVNRKQYVCTYELYLLCVGKARGNKKIKKGREEWKKKTWKNELCNLLHSWNYC